MLYGTTSRRGMRIMIMKTIEQLMIVTTKKIKMMEKITTRK